jgi:transcriptional regulator with XRE-family HTH domain
MESVSNLPFADLLKRPRVAAGLTQEELSVRAHLSRHAISALERGIGVPSGWLLIVIRSHSGRSSPGT